MVDDKVDGPTEVKVIKKNDRFVFAKFPSMDIPVKMTIQYFKQLQKSGLYIFTFGPTLAF